MMQRKGRGSTDRKRSADSSHGDHPDDKSVYIADVYRIILRLGGGAFGEVFSVEERDSKQMRALKLELARGDRVQHLANEARLYRYLNSCPVRVGIPNVYFYSRVDDYNVMVMDMLGPALEELFTRCNKKFSIKTVCMIGIQIINRLEFIHSMHYLHRDIKPENFVMGVGENSHVVYMIDIGLAKRYRNVHTLEHIPMIEGKALTGTARYASINTHLGYQQGRRDDLEAVTYLLLYFLRGSLPWQGLKSHKNDVRYERICEVKRSCTPESLCEGYPNEFGELVRYAREMKFEEEPNYDFCVSLLELVLFDMGEKFDYCYEWISKSSKAASGSEYDTYTSPRNRAGMTASVFEQFHKPRPNPSRSRTMAATSGGSMRGPSGLNTNTNELEDF